MIALATDDCKDDPAGYQGYDCDYAECNYKVGDDWYDNWRLRCKKKCGICSEWWLIFLWCIYFLQISHHLPIIRIKNILF